MFWVSKVFAPLALVAGIAVATLAVGSAEGNQPPFGRFGQPGKGFPGKDGKKTDGKKTDDRKGEDKKGDRKGDRKDDRKVEDKKGQSGDRRGAAAKADPQVEAWLAILLTKITDPHDTVRESARGAVIAVGAPALPALQKLADGDDAAKAVAARKIISAIQGRGGDRGGPAAKGGERGGPGERGFGPPGGRGFSGPGGERGERGFGTPGMGGRGFGGFGGFGGWGGGERERGPGGFGPGGKDKGGERGGPPGKGPGRGGREEEENEVQVAPMPRSVASR